MVKIASCSFCLLVGAFQACFGQSESKQVVNQSIEWFSATANLKMTNRLSMIVEGQFRFAEKLEPMQHQARTALEVKLSNHFSVIPLGYVYTWNYKYGKQPAAFKNNEHRIWQQVFYKHSLGKLKVDHRLRLEERFIQIHSLSGEQVIDEGYTNVQTRLRYRLMMKMPLSHSTIQPKSYFLSAYDEIFFSRGEKVTYHEPDQNRVFAGFGYQVSNDLSIQSGFLYQMLVKANGTKQENNLGVQVFVNYTLDLSKGE